MPRRKIRIDWKGSNPPTHFPGGPRIPAKLRKGLRREFFKVKSNRQKKLERCVRKVKKKVGVMSPHAICRASIFGKKRKKRK